jgi:hypothetical protein
MNAWMILHIILALILVISVGVLIYVKATYSEHPDRRAERLEREMIEELKRQGYR